mmetsp:Transcript_26107/g.85669  ORF Transcript_26107/g.85669 Transcript_26107/m.85669 type:complete len:249 (+) Transcript_26107:45-791(+)
MGRTKARQTSQDSARDAVDAAARRARDFHLAFNGCEDAYIHRVLVTAAWVLVTAALSPRDFVLCLGTSHLFTEAVLTEAHIVENLIVFAPFKLASLLAGTSRVKGAAFMEQVLYALRYFMVLLSAPPLFPGSRLVVPGNEGREQAVRIARVMPSLLRHPEIMPATVDNAAADNTYWLKTLLPERMINYLMRAKSVAALRLLVQWRLLQLDALGAEHSEAHRRERRRTIVRRWSELGCWEELVICCWTR